MNGWTNSWDRLKCQRMDINDDILNPQQFEEAFSKFGCNGCFSLTNLPLLWPGAVAHSLKQNHFACKGP